MTIFKTELEANGLRFATRTQGEGQPVLCLHGFPDSYHSFDVLLGALAEAGFQGFAPAMRGYAPTGIASDGRYDIPTLAEDIIGLIDAIGGGKPVPVIGHDWGGVAAQAAAAIAPEKIQCLVSAAIPPLRRAARWPGFRQLRRSWYIGFFQLPVLPELRTKKGDLDFIRQLWQDWSPGWQFSDEEFEKVQMALGCSENMDAALGYYRALPKALLNKKLRRRFLVTCPVSALFINGADDGCIGSEMFYPSAVASREDSQFLSIADAGHVMHCEQPEVFNNAVVDFLNRQCPQ